MAQCLVFIGGLGGVDCDLATASESNVLKGKTFGKAESDDIVTGTMPDNKAISATVQVNGSYTIPIGYHNGSGRVTGQSVATQTAITHTPSNPTTNYTIVSAKTYMYGNIVIKGDANLVPANIKKGVTIFGIQGTAVNTESEQVTL